MIRQSGGEEAEGSGHEKEQAGGARGRIYGSVYNICKAKFLQLRDMQDFKPKGDETGYIKYYLQTEDRSPCTSTTVMEVSSTHCQGTGHIWLTSTAADVDSDHNTRVRKISYDEATGSFYQVKYLELMSCSSEVLLVMPE